jgi:hypothetical protein
MMRVPSIQHALRQVEVILVKMERINVAFVVALSQPMRHHTPLLSGRKQKLVVILMVQIRLYLAKQLVLVKRSVPLVVVVIALVVLVA